jgi:hypothetical protein
LRRALLQLLVRVDAGLQTPGLFCFVTPDDAQAWALTLLA